MRNAIGKLGALAAGALAMYYLDPQLGAARRAAFMNLLRSGLPPQPSTPVLVRSRVVRRAYHLPAKADPQADAELRERIRERLDRLVSHPRALQVAVQNGVVRLSGNVLAKERDGLLLQVQELPGVQKLVNATTVQDSPERMGDPQSGTNSGRQAA